MYGRQIVAIAADGNKGRTIAHAILLSFVPENTQKNILLALNVIVVLSRPACQEASCGAGAQIVIANATGCGFDPH